MPNPTKSHITLILDRSGSMGSIKNDVIGAVNQFIEAQKAVPGECSFTLVQFDTQQPFEVVHDGPLYSANTLTNATYEPRGGTPLLDAMGKGINSLGEKLAAMSDADRPGKIIFVVQTDGEENSSHEFTKAKIAEMIKHQTEAYKWQFVFLGANQDAIKTGASLGFAAGSSLQTAHTGAGMRAAMGASSANVAQYRASAKMDAVPAYTEDQRAEALQK